MTPFQALHGLTPLVHLPYFPREYTIAVVDAYIQDRESVI